MEVALLRLDESGRRFTQAFTELREVMDPETLVQPASSLGDAEPATVAARARACAAALDQVPEWISFKGAVTAAEALGLAPFLKAAADVPAAELLTAFQRAFYERWIDWVHSQEPVLRNFDARDHNRLVEEFRRLDAEIKLVNRDRV